MVMVSVIVPVYNVEKELARCLDSILHQSYQNFECILVNDGSTDRAGKICDRYKELDDRVTVIHQQNSGSGYARNTGIKRAKGKYVYFADADDYLELELLEKVVEAAEQTAAELVIFGYFDDWESRQGHQEVRIITATNTFVSSKEAFRSTFEDYYFLAYRNLWNKFYLRSYLSEHHILFTDQRVGEDARFNLMVFKHLERVKTIPYPLYHYVYRDGSAVNHYHEERFQDELNLARHFRLVMESWQKEAVYEYLIDQEYTDAVRAEMKNLILCGNALPKIKKIKKIDWMMQLPEMQAAVKRRAGREKSNLYARILLLLLSGGFYRQALRIMKWQLFMRLRITVAHTLIEKKIVKAQTERGVR